MKFEQTSLLRHPIVEKAFTLLQQMARTTGQNDVFLQRVLRPAEIVSRYARNPDPEMLVASMLMEYKPNRRELEAIVQETTPRVAEYYDWLLDVDVKRPQIENMAQRQAFLGHAIRALETLQVVSCESYSDYSSIKVALADCEILMLAAMDGTEDTLLLEQALIKFIAVRDGLEEEVMRRQEKLSFENTGLPDHPTVRGVYDLMKAELIRNDPFARPMKVNVGIAKMIVETGASNDPEVIAVALLQRLYRSGEQMEELERKFSPRLAALYSEASSWNGFTRLQVPAKDEVLVLIHARETLMLEDMVDDCLGLLQNAAHFNRSSFILQLERIESLREDVAIDIADQSHPGLRARMQAAVDRADRFIHSPESVTIRKPGTHPQNPAFDI